jgi:peptidoglycan/xylan/chitin deacetylase (PgdA/CDA1 family)
MTPGTAAVLLLALGWGTDAAPALAPIPDRLVVLTFDDASKSHFTVARPVLKKHGFGATFFVTEGWDFATNKRDYMSWDEIAQLHRDGFEIGNHTRDHRSLTAANLSELSAQVRAINERCKQHGIPAPISFAYPGNAILKEGLPVLKDLGIRFARRGGAPEYPYKEGRGFAYEPGRDHPLLIPSAGDARPAWTMDDLKQAVNQARDGKIAVLQFHGVPDTAHDWVTTTRQQFDSYMKYLADHGCKVIAVRDLARYVDPRIVPADPWAVIEARKRRVQHRRDDGPLFEIARNLLHFPTTTLMKGNYP